MHIIIITKTSIPPISMKRIELSGAPNIEDGQTHIPGMMQSSPTMIKMISESEKVIFQMVTERNYAI